jgi:hypothetical protein
MNHPVALPGFLQMLLGLYAYLVPLLLYGVWSTLALWDLGKSPARSSTAVWGWTAAVFLLPFLGPVLYAAFGGAALSRRMKWTAFAGGAAFYIAVLLIGAAAGGVA